MIEKIDIKFEIYFIKKFKGTKSNSAYFNRKDGYRVSKKPSRSSY